MTLITAANYLAKGIFSQWYSTGGSPERNFNKINFPFVVVVGKINSGIYNTSTRKLLNSLDNNIKVNPTIIQYFSNFPFKFIGNSISLRRLVAHNIISFMNYFENESSYFKHYGGDWRGQQNNHNVD